jgi:SAM-dependent methyltransferase
MRSKLLDLLACPRCRGPLSCRPRPKGEEDLQTATLRCSPCGASYPVERGIPRFVPPENYTASFGLQWNSFKAEQIDSLNGTELSRRRFFNETGWAPGWLASKSVLDVGCGAGRFLDAAAPAAGALVGLDMSSAVDAAAHNLAGRANVHLVQGSVYEMPFRPGVFDAVYCIGVIQHTPDPARALSCLPTVVKPGGQIAVTIYERKRFSLLYSKYLLRPFTTRLDKGALLRWIEAAMPVAFPVTEVLFRVPVLKRYFRFAIPVANYPEARELTLRQRYRWAILDTFDMLAPEFDQPQTQGEVEEALRRGGAVALRRLPNPGLNVVAEKQA